MPRSKCLQIDLCDNRVGPGLLEEPLPCLCVKTTHRMVPISDAETRHGEEVFRKVLWRGRV